MVFGALQQIAAFEMIPTDKFYDDMLEAIGSGEALDFLFVRMESLGFETVWLLPNLGSFLLFMCLYPMMIVIWLTMICLGKLRCASAQRREEQLRPTIFWNWPISFLRDSYIVIVICCLYNASHTSWSHPLASLNSGLCYTILVLLIMYPLGI